MASSITIESLDLGEALVDEAEALVTYKRLADKAGLSEKIAIFLVNDMGCRTLEDLENLSEAQVDDKIIPAITDLDIPLVMSSRLKKLIKAIREAARVSWDRKRKGTVEDEDVPLPSEELKRLESLFFSRYKLRFSADEDAGETVVSRLKRQLNKHCIRFENIIKTRTRKGETAETRIKRTKLGDKTELIEREEPERKQPKTITAEVYLDALWTYILGLARAGVEELQDKPSAAETDGSQTYDYVQIPLDVTMNYHARAKRFAASLPKDRALTILKEIDEAERMMWPERVRGPKAGMVIHQILMERAHAWAWHDKPLAMSRRPKKLVSATQETAIISWDQRRKGSVEDEDVSLPSEEVRRLEALLFCGYNLSSPADENAREAVEREEPTSQLNTITTEVYLDALWTYIRCLARAGVEGLQDEPSAAETEGLQSYDYKQIPLAVTMSYHYRAK